MRHSEFLSLAERNSVMLGRAQNQVKTISLYSDQCFESNDHESRLRIAHQICHPASHPFSTTQNPICHILFVTWLIY